MKRPFKPLSIASGWVSKPVKGFTLPELLVASLIAALIAGITAQVMIGQLLRERRLEAAQRNRENFSRLNYLLQIEASEAEQIEVGVAPPGCNAGGFTLWIPRPDQQYGPSINRSGVQYVNSGGGIWRCGPRVFQNGTLEHSDVVVGSDGAVISAGSNTVVPGEALRNATLTLISPPLQPAKQVEYEVNFADGNLGIAGGLERVTIHAKSVFVCNPPVGSGGEIGDCQ